MNLSSPMMSRLARIHEACRSERSPARLWERISTTILESVPADIGAFAITDPVTGLVVDGYSFGDPTYTHRYISEFYLRNELYSSLDQRTDGVVCSLMSEYTCGNLERDPVYRDWLRYDGFKHGARIWFVAGRHYWGGITFIRSADTHDFSHDETSFLRALVEPVGTAIRTAAAWKQAFATPPADAGLPDAGVMLLDHGHRVLFRTEGVQRILDDMMGLELPEASGRLHRLGSSLPAPVYAASAQLRAALLRGTVGPNPTVTMKGCSQWWTITATAPEVDAPKEVATVLVLARALPRDTASVILAAYDLTPREEEIVRWVRKGLSTNAIANRMFVSHYTVQDHLKRIFSKVGVRTRGELMAAVFREESPVGRILA